MSIEGSIRDLGLHEVCQLLGLGRKTGRLALRATLRNRAAEISFMHGAIADADSWTLDAATAGERRPDDHAAHADTRRVEELVLELLTWRDGEFRFIASEPASLPTSSVRVGVEPMLMQAAQRASVWERVADRIPGATAVPAFVDVESGSLPLLKLEPQEWEILTRVDGRRDLVELSRILGRDLLDVAQIVYDLLGSGLLVLRSEAVAPRRHATPPSTAAVSTIDAGDLWIPGDDQDVIFDPVRTGVFTPEGLPRLRTPLGLPSIAAAGIRAKHQGEDGAGPSMEAAFASVRREHPPAVASHLDEPSSLRGVDAPFGADDNAATLCRRGDEAARRGDLASALAHWTAALRPSAWSAQCAIEVDADRIREAIALAARLHALLHPSQPVAPTN